MNNYYSTPTQTQGHGLSMSSLPQLSPSLVVNLKATTSLCELRCGPSVFLCLHVLLWQMNTTPLTCEPLVGKILVSLCQSLRTATDTAPALPVTHGHY